MWIKDTWYMAGWASEVKENELLARTLLNEPVALYRGESGALVAMEDRCCHRFAPLSKGRIEGDCVRCMYHGLKFDADGKCVEVPGSEQVSDHLFVQTYPLVEKMGLLWIWMGDPAKADPEDIVDWPYWDHPDWAYREGYVHYDSNYLLIGDNLLDFTHLNYVHANSIGSDPSTEQPPVLERTDFGIRIQKNWLGDEPAPHVKKFGKVEGKVDRWTTSNWYYRGNILLMYAGSAVAGGTLEPGHQDNLVEFRHTSIQTPETDGSSHYFYCQARNFGLEEPGLSDRIHTAIIDAFEEDREMIEAQQRVIDSDPSSQMKTIPWDKAVIYIRRQIDRAIQDEQQSLQAAE